MFIIDDSNHAEHQGEFASFDEAFAELIRRSRLPWNESPNLAPCGSWETCGRRYEIAKFDDSTTPITFINRVFVLEITSAGVIWAEGFQGIKDL